MTNRRFQRRPGVALVRLSVVCGGLALLLYAAAAAPLVRSKTQIDCGRAETASAAQRWGSGPRNTAAADSSRHRSDNRVATITDSPCVPLDHARWRITPLGIDPSSLFTFDTRTGRAAHR